MWVTELKIWSFCCHVNVKGKEEPLICWYRELSDVQERVDWNSARLLHVNDFKAGTSHILEGWLEKQSAAAVQTTQLRG